ncbi:MAG: HDIG domain-containing metalloprotein [Balneolales bacterium]
MGFLEKLGLNRKKKAYVPFTTEKLKKDQVPGPLNRNNIFKLALSLVFLILVIGLYPKSPYSELAYSIGEPWRNEDLTAPFTFSILKDDSEIRDEINDIQQNTFPIFLIDQQPVSRTFNRLDTVFERMDEVVDAYLDWQNSRIHMPELAYDDSLRFIEIRNLSGLRINESSWDALLDQLNDSRLAPDQGGNMANDFIGYEIQSELESILESLFSAGIINLDKENLTSDEITIRNLDERTEQDVNIDRVRTINEALEYAENRLSNRFEDEIFVVTGSRLLNQIIEPNLFFSNEDTESLIQERIEAISPTKGAVSEGQVIIRRGDIITPDRHNILQNLARARAERASEMELWRQYIGETILVIAVSLIFFLYIFLYRRKIFDQNPMLLLVFLTVALVYSIGAFVARVEDVSPYVVPFAISPILLTIIFDSRVGLMTTSLLALLAGLMYGNNFEFVVATITACSIGVYSVRDIKDRSQFYLTTPALIFFSYALVLFGFTLTKVGGWPAYFNNLIFLLGNAVGIWLTYPLILLIEKTFRITTDVTLLELSDTNQPILKKLMLEAPGSFHHSLQVANLAEASASGIAANSLLCRVGALYHDIGKLEKPQYFVENQQSGNVHDKLKPRMSALIIKNHVDTGVKMAKEIELPDILIDFIRTHHGTSLIRYFYEKAMNESGNEQEIQEEDFRYNGPIPNSKETGILLLADGVEAASRSMSDHSYQKLENLVNRLVDDRLAEGQLNDCSLTLKDLNIIKEIFTRILQGMYHGRVKYPGQEEDESSAVEDQRESGVGEE